MPGKAAHTARPQLQQDDTDGRRPRPLVRKTPIGNSPLWLFPGTPAAGGARPLHPWSETRRARPRDDCL